MKVIIYMHLYKFAVTQGIYMINLRLTFTSQGEKKTKMNCLILLACFKKLKKKKKTITKNQNKCNFRYIISL